MDAATLHVRTARDVPRVMEVKRVAPKLMGLLVDTARHFLPVADALLPLLDGMAALKLNVLHWHLTDTQAFQLGSGTAVPTP